MGALVEDAKVEQLADLAFGDGGLVAEVELLQALDRGEAGLAQVERVAVALTPLALQVYQLLDQLQVEQVVGLGLGE